jgi:hypothetical protein
MTIKTDFLSRFRKKPKHDLYISDSVVVEQKITIDENGDVKCEGNPTIVDWEDYIGIYCRTCNDRVYFKDGHGLSSDWERL